MSRLPKMSFQRLLGVILVILSVASVVLVAVQTAHLRDVTACQSAYNDAYTHAIQVRSQAARDERAAQRELLLTVLNPQIPVPEKRAAFNRYLAKLGDADKVRDAAQIPTRRC